jgi:hypothetical protein
MLLHQLVFFGRQLAGLVEDGVGNSHFADVMEQRGDLQVRLVALAQPKFSSHVQGPLCQARAVYAGIEVLEVQELVECADKGRAQSDELFLHFFDAQRRMGLLPGTGRG